MNEQERDELHRMFHPRGVAVFGAVHEPGKFGHMMIQCLVRYGYPGRIFPIHPGGGEVYGHGVLRTLAEAEGPVDLACVCVPAQGVPEVLEECLEKGVAGAQVLTSGFAETGTSEGAGLQEKLAAFGRRGLRIIGPNCFGSHCPRGGITLLPGFDFSREAGPVALLSQSGGVATDFGHEARMAGFGLSKVVSFGNGCDLDGTALLEYLAEDPETGFVGVYLEGVRDGARFLKTLRRTCREKPVVVWKGGLTPAGGRATRSHTGSLGGEARVWEGALAQAGAVQTQGLEEMVDAITALVHFRRRGRRVAVVGGGGAIGVFSSDLAHGHGLSLPPFSAETQKRLRKWFPTPGNSVVNPLDTGTPVLSLETLGPMMEEILVREPVDAMLVILLLHPLCRVLPAYMEMDGLPPPAREEYLERLLTVLHPLRERTGKDLVVAMENRANLPDDLEIEGLYRTMRRRFQSKAIPVYPTAGRALQAIRNAHAAGENAEGIHS